MFEIPAEFSRGLWWELYLGGGLHVGPGHHEVAVIAATRLRELSPVSCLGLPIMGICPCCPCDVCPSHNPDRSLFGILWVRPRCTVSLINWCGVMVVCCYKGGPTVGSGTNLLPSVTLVPLPLALVPRASPNLLGCGGIFVLEYGTGTNAMCELVMLHGKP